MNLIVCKWNYHERKKSDIGVISKWIDTSHLSIKAQANLDRTLDQLRQLPKTSWSKPQPASSLGNHTYVIRFRDVTGAQLRIFGHFHDAHQTFVMTFDGCEKDNVYYPKDYKEVAERYKIECDKNLLGTTIAFRKNCAICKPKDVTSSA